MRQFLDHHSTVFFTETHEWVKVESPFAFIGIGEKAKKELGTIVYLELPKVGDFLEKDETACVLESTKAAIDIPAAISGVVVDVNVQLQQNPNLLHQEPNFSDWLYKVHLKDFSELESLISIEDYTKSEEA